MSKNYKYILDFVGNNRQLINAIDQNERKLNELGNKATQAGNKLGGFMDGAGKQLLAFGSFTAISAGAISLFSNVVNVRKEFEKYEAVLTNSLGSQQKAADAMKMLQNFASGTPFALTELTGSFVKLTNYGLKPTIEDMRRYGDLASSVGKGFDQLAEAVADAVTGEFERLKEFGVKASKEGDKVTFTFKEQKTTVDNTADAIKKYITNLGELQGVSGSMAAISETLGGKISNLGDAWDGLMNSMGSKSSGTMVAVIEFLTSATNKISGLILGVESAQGRGQGLIKSILGDLPKDSAEAKKKIETELSDLKSWLYDFQTQLAKEQGRRDINSVIFRSEHADRIKSLKREIDAYSFAIDNLQKTYEEQVKAEKEAEEKRKKEAAAALARKASIQGLSDEIENLNKKLAATNSTDVDSIRIIGEKIQALEKQKKAIAAIASEPSSFRADSFDSMSLRGYKASYWGYKIPDFKLSTGKKDDKPFNLKPKLDVKDFTANAERFAKANEYIRDELEATNQKAQTIATAFADGFSAIGKSVVDGLGLATNGLEGFIGGLASTAVQFISMMLAKSLAAAIFSAEQMAALTGPGGIFAAPVLIGQAIAGVMSAFAAIPKFAAGGLAYGPTVGLMGEYPGASSNPEVIAPLSKLQAMLAPSGGTTVILQPGIDFDGDRMRIFLKRLESNVNKRT